MQQYRDPVLQKCLPDLQFATDNHDGSVKSSVGAFVFPPLMVIERGLAMSQWVAGERRTIEVLVLVESAAELLNTLHSNGRVHRDIKPDNLLYLPGSAVWRLLDMGICAPVGLESPPCYTPAYAPPEVIRATRSGETVVVDASHDVWALGVIAYEAITGTRALATRPQADACACEGVQYPWEQSEDRMPEKWVRSRLRAIMRPCLDRRAGERPPAAAIAEAVNRMGRCSTIAL